MTNIDEIKTLITLTGSKRIPHLEKEIFANECLTELYLTQLCTEYSMFNYNKCYYVFFYAIGIMKAPWPEAESTIKEDITIYSLYRKNFNIQT